VKVLKLHSSRLGFRLFFFLFYSARFPSTASPVSDKVASCVAMRGSSLATRLLFVVLLGCVASSLIGCEAKPLPKFPTQFRAKARIWFSDDDKPILVLYHHDGVSMRAREDYYSLIESRHQRFYTSIKSPERGINFMILHKQEKSPRACFITPTEGLAVDHDLLQTAEYIGPSSLQYKGEDVACDHWRVDYHGIPTEVCIDKDGKPLVIESQHFRIDVLDFDEHAADAHIFDARRASDAPCGVIGSPPPSEQVNPDSATGDVPRPF